MNSIDHRRLDVTERQKRRQRDRHMGLEGQEGGRDKWIMRLKLALTWAVRDETKSVREETGPC